MRSFIAAFVGFCLGATATALVVVAIYLAIVEPVRKSGSEFSEFEVLSNVLVSVIVLILSLIGGGLGAVSSVLFVNRNNRD